MTDTLPRLSSYPAPKIVMDCDTCGIHVQFDKAACVRKSDLTLIDFMAAVRAKYGCKGHAASGNPSQVTCRLVYTGLYEMMKGG